MHEENVWLTLIVLCLLSKTQPVSMDERKTNLNFLLVGKTGSGKSATGNTILGKRLFETSSGVNSLTKDTKRVDSNHYGRKLTVVDSPGFIDSHLSPTEYLPVYFDYMNKAMRASHNGYHAFLFVVRYGVRQTHEDELTFEALSKCFGEGYLARYGVLVVTFGALYDPEENNFESFSDWISTQESALKEIKEKLGGRVVLFDNKNKDESKRKFQVDQLINIVDQISAMNSRYTIDHFHLGRIQRQQYLVEAKLHVIELEVKKEIDLVIEQLNYIMSSRSQSQLNQLNGLKAILAKLLRNIKKEDMGTGVLNGVIAGIQKIDENIQQGIDSLRRNQRGNELQKHGSGGLINNAIEAANYVLSLLVNFVKRYVLGIDPAEYNRLRLH